MRAVLLSSNSILKFPEPSATIVGLDSQAVEIELSFRVGGIGKTAAAKNEIFDLVYRHTKAAGLQLAGPAGVALPVQDDGSVEQASKHPGTAWRLLNSVPLFATLTEDEKEALASSMKRLTFRKDTIIAAPDTSLTSLMIVRTGVAVVERDGVDGQADLARLAPGDLFGERGVLMGALERGNIRALTFVVVYEISKDHLASVMHDRPALAEELGMLLAKRMEMEKHLVDGAAGIGHPTTLTARIRHLFQIQHAARYRASDAG
ncbi:Crp/Fnr family transcriptional regulator [Pararhizobium sp. LjRoot238]|uniref:Crp/Fnr family transcriptional regulator n=1 Tax=Pararhizobium sp. LjRoot238 TaxID=3342293 RepID=UPI003F4F6976